jgi:N-acetylmuramoyl-L-alanine amidase CwlA
MSYERITRFNSPNYTPESRVAEVFGVPRVVTSITIHHWGDPATTPTFSGVIDWLCRPNGNSSAHAVIEAGRVAYLVNYKDASWNAGNARGNATTIGLELNPRASDADYQTAGEHVADIWMVYGIVPLFPHKQWTPTACPGKWDVKRLLRIASEFYGKKKAAQERANGGPVTPEFHTVKKGETLYSIARKYSLSILQVLSYNKVRADYVIHPGEKIRLKKQS